MSDTAFCIDETSFNGLLPDAHSANKKLIALVELIDDARSLQSVGIEVVADVYDRAVDDGPTNLAMMLFDETVGHLDRDLAVRLQIHLEQCSNFEPEEGSQTVKLQRDGVSEFVESQALYRAANISDRYYCVLTSSTTYKLDGKVSVSTNQLSNGTFILRIADDFCHYFRAFLGEEGTTEEQFFGHLEYGFPKLYFHPELTFSNFSRSYSENRSTVIEHFEFLNDSFLSLAEGFEWDMPRIIKAAPINLSDESPLTKKNRDAIRKRDISVGDLTIRCTLHTKLSPQRDRIHFHPPVFNDICGDKIIIGIFHEHLPT